MPRSASAFCALCRCGCRIWLFVVLPLIGLDVPAMLVTIGMTEAAVLRRILRPPGRRTAFAGAQIAAGG